MKKRFTQLLVSLGLITASLVPVPVMAIDVFQNCGGGGGTPSVGSGATAGLGGNSGGGQAASTGSGSQICGATGDSFPDIMKNVINTMLFVLGIIAVVMIIIGGIRYVTSNGEAQQIKSAKDTILYSVIGIVVAVMAYAIVNFVLARLKGNS